MEWGCSSSSPSSPSCPVIPEAPTDKPQVKHQPITALAWGKGSCRAQRSGHQAKLTDRHRQHRDKQEKNFIYIFQAAAQRWPLPGKKLQEQTRGCGPPQPPVWHLGPCRMLEGRGFSTELKENMARREGEGLGACRCGVWSMKVHSTTILVEKSVPRAGGMRGRRASASTEGFGALKTSAQGLSWGKPNRRPRAGQHMGDGCCSADAQRLLALLSGESQNRAASD